MNIFMPMTLKNSLPLLDAITDKLAFGAGVLAVFGVVGLFARPGKMYRCDTPDLAGPFS